MLPHCRSQALNSYKFVKERGAVKSNHNLELPPQRGLASLGIPGEWAAWPGRICAHVFSSFSCRDMKQAFILVYPGFLHNIGECIYLVSFWGYKKCKPYFIMLQTNFQAEGVGKKDQRAALSTTARSLTAEFGKYLGKRQKPLLADSHLQL